MHRKEHMRYLLLASLWLVVAVHMVIVWAVIIAFFVLPCQAPWFIALPLMVYIASLVLTRVDCPLTNLENVLRQRLGKQRIGGYVGHYIIKPIKRRFRR